MNSEWQSFLSEAGARIEEGRVAHFGMVETEAEAAINSNVISDLSHYGVIEVTGEDAPDFLQGQFSNDVRLVTDAHSQLSSYCNPKGRVLADFRLLRRDETYLMRLSADLLEATLKRLRMYVLRSKVILEDASDRLARFGLSGPSAPLLLNDALGQTPAEIDDAVTIDRVTIIRTPGPHPRYEIYGTPEPLTALWQTLSDKTRPVGMDAWQLLDIRVGVPTVFSTTSEAFVPQMINLHAIDGVSFRKGCYPGQEVVARMQYLGKLKRRMYLAHVDGSNRPAPGAELYTEDAESGQGAGKVVDARPAVGGGFDMLAVIQIASVEDDRTIRIGNGAGPVIHLEDLPYDVPVSKEG